MLYFPDVYPEMQQASKSMNLWEILTQNILGWIFLNNSFES